MKIKCETDKRVNIYALWNGDQIVLCKKSRRKTPINHEDWIVLWPTKSGEGQMINDEPPERRVDFALSDKGMEYLYKIYYENIKNTYIAKVEYYPIDGTNPSLWEELYGIGEFVLWDTLLGPVKIFKNSPRQNLLAIYRVYEINYEITEKDVRNSQGDLPRYKEVNEEASKMIVEALKYAKPVLSDNDFEERKKAIIKVIEKYPPREYNIKESGKYESPIVENYGYKKDMDIDVYAEGFEKSKLNEKILENKYCIYCGVKLPYEANYCYKCGKKQPLIQ